MWGDCLTDNHFIILYSKTKLINSQHAFATYFIINLLSNFLSNGWSPEVIMGTSSSLHPEHGHTSLITCAFPFAFNENASYSAPYTKACKSPPRHITDGCLQKRREAFVKGLNTRYMGSTRELHTRTYTWQGWSECVWLYASDLTFLAVVPPPEFQLFIKSNRLWKKGQFVWNNFTDKTILRESNLYSAVKTNKFAGWRNDSRGRPCASSLSSHAQRNAATHSTTLCQSQRWHHHGGMDCHDFMVNCQFLFFPSPLV